MTSLTHSHFDQLIAWLQQQPKPSVANLSLHVGTLNATGTFNNPLEYDDGSELYSVINANFVELVKQRFTPQDSELVDEAAIKRFYDLVNTVDKEANKVRFSPLYNPTIPLNNMDESTFNHLWDEVWMQLDATTKKKINKVLPKEYAKMFNSSSSSPEQLEGFLGTIQLNVRLFDWLAYCAIRQAEITDLSVLHGRLVTIEEKTQMLHQLVNKQQLDVLFLQEMFDVHSVPEGYHLLQAHLKNPLVNTELKDGFGERTGMLLRTEFQGIELPSFQSPTFLHETFYGYLVGDIIFVSVHLNSKNRIKAGTISSTDQEGNVVTVTNPKNFQDQKLELDWLFDLFYAAGYRVVCGMDANHPVQVNALYLQAFPNNLQPVYTTSKMRLDMQAQYGKRREWAKECRDTIIVSGHIQHAVVQTLDGIGVMGEDAPRCPTRNHPFDHLLVLTDVTI